MSSHVLTIGKGFGNARARGEVGMANSSFSKADSSFSKIDGHGAPVNISYPHEWSDRDRMTYLLAPFPPSTQTVLRDNSKFSFWSSLVLSSSRELCSPVISEKDLQERFKWNGQNPPKCLGLVLEEMERIGHLVKLSDFYATDQSSWMWWSVGVLKKPVSWAMRSYLAVKKYEGGYIIKPLVEVSLILMYYTV